ncbi:hypothetical protein CPB85DRAFT_1324064 [Mucidula mucida]|nr:hypothetical protein CPB85DRAFT_1324064 [Mucidula mucida]
MVHVALSFGALFAVQGVSAAVTSLYFPGFDPQSLSVDVLGVEGDKTTYAVQKGVYTNSLDDESGFEGTATLVEGPDSVYFTYEDPDAAEPLTLGFDCALSDGMAICSGIQDGITYTATETAVGFEVAIGTTAAVTGDSSASVTQTSGGAAKTGTSSSTASGSQSTSDAAGMLVASSNLAIGATVTVLGFMFL